MSLEPILAAGLPTRIHLVSITVAFATGTSMLVRPNGTAPHRAPATAYVSC